MTKFIFRILCKMLFLFTLVSCRSNSALTHVKDLDGSVPQSPLFTRLCNHPQQANKDERLLFRSFLGSAFEVTTTDPWGATTSSADPSEVLANYSCSEIWEKFQEKPSFSILSIVEDLSALALLNGIKNLELSYTINTLAKNFEILRTLDVTSIGIVANGVGVVQLTAKNHDDILTTLAAVPSLKKIKLLRLGMTSLNALTPLKDVTSIDFTSNAIGDLGFLAQWSNLTSLRAYGNNIIELSALRDLLQLEYLDLSANRVRDIGPLMFLGNLVSLSFNNNPELDDILALQFLPNLKFLNLNNSGVRIIDPLARLQLESLSLEHCPVDSIEPIKQMPLHTLFLRGTKITDLTPIKSMTSLQKLNIANTRVSELPELSDSHRLHTLSLEGTAVTNYCPAYKYPNIKNLMHSNGTIWTKVNGISAHCR